MFKVPIIEAMIVAAGQSLEQLRAEIGNVRYGKPGTILFEFRNQTYSAPEPKDVMPAYDAVGTNAEASRAWALRQILDGAAKQIQQ